MLTRVCSLIGTQRSSPSARCRPLSSGFNIRRSARRILGALAMFAALLTQPIYGQAEVSDLSLSETIRWLANKVDAVQQEHAPVPDEEFSRWSVMAVDTCMISIRETVYDVGGDPRLITVWRVPLADLDAEHLGNQITVEQKFLGRRSDMSVALKLAREKRLNGIPELIAPRQPASGEDAIPHPEVVSTSELVLPLPAAEIDIEKALLHAASLCGADRGFD